MFRQEKYPYGIGYSVRSNTPPQKWCSTKSEYVGKIIARIGRSRPIYRDEYAILVMKIAPKFASLSGLQSMLRSMQVDSRGYHGHGYGRFCQRKNGFDFELHEYSDMTPHNEPQDSYCLLSDWYTCEGCGVKRNIKTDPAKREYGRDEYAWGQKTGTIVSKTCCKKCRAELRRITRETRVLKENRALINKLNQEIRNVAN